MPLYSEQRKQAILTTLAAAGRVDVAAMSEQLAVTSETVRKDLIALERQGRLRRVHGGHPARPDQAGKAGPKP